MLLHFDYVGIANQKYPFREMQNSDITEKINKFTHREFLLDSVTNKLEQSELAVLKSVTEKLSFELF